MIKSTWRRFWGEKLAATRIEDDDLTWNFLQVGLFKWFLLELLHYVVSYQIEFYCADIVLHCLALYCILLCRYCTALFHFILHSILPALYCNRLRMRNAPTYFLRPKWTANRIHRSVRWDRVTEFFPFRKKQTRIFTIQHEILDRLGLRRRPNVTSTNLTDEELERYEDFLKQTETQDRAIYQRDFYAKRYQTILPSCK